MLCAGMLWQIHYISILTHTKNGYVSLTLQVTYYYPYHQIRAFTLSTLLSQKQKIPGLALL